MFSSIFRRTFSTTVRELGSELKVSSLKLSESQKYFKLERLSDFEEVVQAPEGSVVLVDSEVPTQFQQVMEAVGILNCKVGELSKQNMMPISRIAKLEANVEICETVKEWQQLLILEHLPEQFSVLSEKDKTFSYLKERLKTRSSEALLKVKPSKDLALFFQIPIVKKLDGLISTREFQEILEFRNKKAHEAVSDFKVLKENFNEIFNHFRWSDPNSLKFDEIQEVFNVA